MPSPLHEALLLLFQNNPRLATHLLREALGVDIPPFTELRVDTANFTDLEPAEYRADLVLTALTDAPVFAIVLEVQLRPDDRKLYSWPAYSTNLRARLKCDVALVVVTPFGHVAKWANYPIRVGPGHLCMPFVLGPDNVPVVTDAARAEVDPELAVLSVMAHGRGDIEQAIRIASAAQAALRSLNDSPHLLLYSDFIESALSEAARKAFQMIPSGYQFQSETIRNSIAKGLAEGQAKGLAEGQAKGLAEGQAKGELEGLREALFAVLDARGLDVTASERELISGSAQLATLTRWLRQAATANSTKDALAQ